MSKTLLNEPEAEADLWQAYLWYEQQRPGLGEDYFLCFEAAAKAIHQYATTFQIVVKQTRRAMMRRFPFLLRYHRTRSARGSQHHGEPFYVPVDLTWFILRYIDSGNLQPCRHAF
jgi:hypothetical protein